MRELHTQEIETVSGAGFFGDFGSRLGGAIGDVVDWASTAIDGKNPVASAHTPAATLGMGIGLIVDCLFSFNISGIPDALATTGNGISQIISSAKANSKKS